MNHLAADPDWRLDNVGLGLHSTGMTDVMVGSHGGRTDHNRLDPLLGQQISNLLRRFK